LGRVTQQSLLEFSQFFYVTGFCGPASVGIALPGSDSATRGVHKHTIEKCFRREFRTAVPHFDSIVEDTGTSSTALQFLQTPFGSIAGPNQSFIFHQIRKVQCLAAFAGTGVPPRFARLRSANESYRL